MNLLDRLKSAAPMVLIGVLFACDDPNEIGDVLNPGSDKIDVLFKEFILPVDNVLIDSIRTDNRSRILVGKYSDPVFGDIRATGYSQFELQSTAFDIRKDPTNEFIIDSAFVQLDVNYFHSDDSTQGHGFDIHTLSDTLFTNVIYLKDFQTPDNDDQIGSLSSFVFRPQFDSLKINITDPDFANNLLEFIEETINLRILFSADGSAVDTSYFIDNSELKNYFKGLAIKPSETNNGVWGFNMASNTSKLGIYYRIKNETESDTVSTALELFTTPSGAKYYNLQVDRSMATLNVSPAQDSVISQFDGINEEVFLQSGTGIHPRIDFRPVNEFLSSIENVIINKAEIEVGLSDSNSEEKFLVRPLDLRFFFYDDNEAKRDRNINVPGLLSNSIDNTLIMTNTAYLGAGPTHLRAALDDDITMYTADATLFTEFVQSGDVEVDKLIIIPSDVSSLNRGILDANSVKVSIFYTVPK